MCKRVHLGFVILVHLLVTVTGVPCVDSIETCVDLVGTDELRALHKWIVEIPSEPHHLHADHRQPGMVIPALMLAKQLGFAVLGVILDFLVFCMFGDTRCTLSHFDQISDLRYAFSLLVKSMVQDYILGAGERSPVMRFCQDLESDMKRFHNELGLDAVGKIHGAADLVHFTGRRSRLLAHHMGLHHWIRSLQVLGRGGPVFILEDYTSREEMIQILVGDVVRHGRPAISVAQVGGEDAGALLAHFTEMTVVAPALASAAAIPERSLDVLFLETHFQRQDIEAWEQRVKLGGILGGSGFLPLSSVVPTICEWRCGTDIHLGGGGTFWWYVEE